MTAINSGTKHGTGGAGSRWARTVRFVGVLVAGAPLAVPAMIQPALASAPSVTITAVTPGTSPLGTDHRQVATGATLALGLNSTAASATVEWTTSAPGVATVTGSAGGALVTGL